MNKLLPSKAVKIVKIETGEKTIYFPLSYLIHAEIEPGKVIFSGFNYDIFSTSISEKGE